jgi:hypothetical protein
MASVLIGKAVIGHSGLALGIVAMLLQIRFAFSMGLIFWCVFLISIRFSKRDVFLVGLLFVLTVFRLGGDEPALVLDEVVLLAGVLLGKIASTLIWDISVDRSSELRSFLVGLVLLLCVFCLWRLNGADSYYHGPRWMGPWNDPNIFGTLMGAGVVLGAGLLAEKEIKEDRRLWMAASIPPVQEREQEGEKRKIGKRDTWEVEQPTSFGLSRRLLRAALFIGGGMMTICLVMSYSRGAWLATAVGGIYLARCCGKLKWLYVLAGVWLVASVIIFFWNATPDSAPWYLKRLDFARPSAQHRVLAWRAAAHMMWDHPLGVGWNQAVALYQRDYSPAVGGAGAIATNDYFMLGTELGLPGLACFVAYAGMSLKGQRVSLKDAKSQINQGTTIGGQSRHEAAALRIVCRAATIVMLVAFWFDSGLFTLATASLFWVLLELGAETPPSKVFCATRGAESHLA